MQRLPWTSTTFVLSRLSAVHLAGGTGLANWGRHGASGEAANYNGLSFSRMVGGNAGYRACNSETKDGSAHDEFHK
jgi:hypothetical protein